MGDFDSTQGFCCTCLKPYETKDELISLNFVPTKDISYKFKLKCCVPEMVLENYEDSFLCNTCLSALETAYTFRCMCLQTEGKLAEFRQNHKKAVEPTITILPETVRIKQEIIDPTSFEEVPDDDHEVYFSEVVELPKSIEIQPKNVMTNLKKEAEVDPFEGLETNTESASFDPFDSEVELLLVDNGKKSKVPQITARKMSDLMTQKVPELASVETSTPLITARKTGDLMIQKILEQSVTSPVLIATRKTSDLMIQKVPEQSSVNISPLLIVARKTSDLMIQKVSEPSTVDTSPLLITARKNSDLIQKGFEEFSVGDTPPPLVMARKTSDELMIPKVLDQTSYVDLDSPIGLSVLEMIEVACKTIPELLAYKCDVASLDCRVSLERINIPGETIKLPVRKYTKKKFPKKYKKFNKAKKKDINYWCHICVKFIAIGRRHRYNAHMLNHSNIKSYKCDKCTKEFTYGETLSKHKRECTGVLQTSPQKMFQIVPTIRIKTEVEEPKTYTRIDVKKIKKERYDVDNDWMDESKAHKYMKIEDTSDADARRSLRAKQPSNKQVYNLTNEAFHCEICEYQTYKKHQYQVHMMKHFNDRRFECTKCPRRFFENWELNRHLRTVHLSNVVNKRPPPNSYDIQNITPLIPRATNISEHTDDTNDSESTTFVKLLEPSVSLTVNNDSVVTPVIQSIESLANDISDNSAISFACKTCNLSFQSHSLLLLHTQTHKVRNPCKVCGQSFGSNAEYLEHAKTHSIDYSGTELYETHIPPKLPPKKKKKKKFFCTICNLEFASKDHANIHTGAKPYDCKVCGKEFAAYSTLRKHRWTHLDEPSNNIEECEQQQQQPESFQRLKYACDICNKTFVNKWQVNSHTCHSATGETVYRCQICKNAFVGRTALIEHMGMHVNQSADFYQ